MNNTKYFDQDKLPKGKIKFTIHESGYGQKPVIKKADEYFVSAEYYLEELRKKDEEIENYKNLVSYYKHELKDTEKENKELKEKLKHFLERLGK